MFDIDLMSRTPIYEQLYSKVVQLVCKGILKEQDRLPSVRKLAVDLGVNPNTVAKAYGLLERDGIVHSLPGRGSFIARTDALVMRQHILEDFDNAAKRALESGIAKEILLKRLENTEEDAQA